MLATLVRLAQKDGDDAGRNGKSAGGAGSAKADADRWSGWRSGAWDKANRKAGAVSSGSEITKPAKLADATGASLVAGDPALPTIETLHGYGKASDWALDLKLDLALWQAGKLPWSQMSTRLLLSGPSGTGKTTFARALCNTLQVPLIATSVSTWLEPSHLGDVIKRMRIAFEEGRATRLPSSSWTRSTASAGGDRRTSMTTIGTLSSTSCSNSWTAQPGQTV